MNRSLSYLLMSYGLVQMIVGFVALSSLPLIARILAPENLAVYSVVIAVVGIYAALSSSAIAACVLRFRPANYEGLPQLYIMVFIVVVLFSSFCLLILLRSFPIIHPDLHVFVLLCCFVNSLFNFLAAFVRSLDRISHYALINLIRTFFLLIALLFIYLMEFGTVQAVILATALSYSVACVASFFLFSYVFQRLQVARYPINLESLLRYGLPIMLNSLIILFLPFALRLAIMRNSGEYALGIFSANFDFSEKLISMVNIVWSVAIGPFLFRVADSDPVNLKDKLEKSVSTFLLIFSPLLALLFLFSDAASRVFLGAEYADGYIYFTIGGINAFLTGLVHKYSIVLSIERRTLLISVSLLPGLIFYCFFIFIGDRWFSDLLLSLGLVVSSCIWIFSVMLISKRFVCFDFPFASFFIAMCFCVFVISMGMLLNFFGISTGISVLLVVLISGVYLYFLWLARWF